MDKTTQQIICSSITLDTEHERVIIDFLEDYNAPRKIIAQLQLEYDEYLDFAMSFISAGVQLQQEFDVDLGINTYKQNLKVEMISSHEIVG